MLTRIKDSELKALAIQCGLAIQHECGGFRVITLEHADFYPNGGVCQTVTKRVCWIFLTGYLASKTNKRPR
jgi:hypothetical protein